METLARALQPGDGAALARVFVEAARAAWAHFLSADRLALLESPAERWERQAPQEVTLVAERGDDLVGFAVVRGSTDEGEDPRLTGELDTFYALPSTSGQGVGRLLMRAALDTLRTRGCREATLWTAEQNERPRRIYEAAGWRPDGARRPKTFLGVALSELRYRIML